MNAFRKCILWFSLLCTAWNASAQASGSFQALSKKDGLSQVSVFSIAQDSSGFMWFGTRNGLNRFDGHRFKVYRKDDSARSLVAGDIRVLHVDPLTHDLWVGTVLGLRKYDITADTFVSYQHSPTDSTSISSDIIRDIFRDSRKRLWIGTSRGLSLFDDEKNNFTRLPLTGNLSSAATDVVTVKTILEDAVGEIWLGTSHGLFRLLENDMGYAFERVDGPGKLQFSDADIRCLLEDPVGNFWIATEREGLNYWDRSMGEITVYQHNDQDPTSLSNNHIRAITLDRYHNLWVGTFDGLNLLEAGANRFKVFKKEVLANGGISDNSIHSLFCDRQGSLWIGTFYGGVNQLNEHYNRFTNFNHIPFENSLSANVVSSFAEDEDHNLWIATEGGGLNFYHRKENTFESYQSQTGVKNTLPGNNIKKLLLEGDQLWIGTFSAGLSVFDLKKKTFRHFQKDPQNSNSLSNNNIYGLHKEENRLWLLTYGGGLDILDLNEERYYNYRTNPNNQYSISSNFTRAILKTKDQQWWIGTEKGLNKVITDTAGFPTRFEMLLPEERIYALQESGEQKIWIGTYTNGLFYFDPKDGTIEHFTIADGLPGNSIFGIIEVSEQEIWLSTNNGLSKFNYTDKTFTNYDHSNGLLNLEYNFNAFHKTSAGELLFGGTDGFTLFHPTAIQPNEYIPPVVFTELRTNGQRINFSTRHSPAEEENATAKTIEFEYGEANFSIGFAALNYINPGNNRFAFKLEGIDKEWIHTVGETEATYTIQREGDYVFRLKAANNDGLWNAEERQLKIVVLPPPWRTWWAYLIYLTLAALLILGLIRYINLQHKLHLEQMAKQQQEDLHEVKLRFFTNITHEFRTPLSLILGPIKELITKEDRPEQIEKLQVVRRNSQRLANLVNQVLTFRKLAADHEPMKITKGNLVDFLKEIFLLFQETARSRHITYSFETEAPEITAWYDAEKLEKVFFNLLANAFKFTADHGHIEMRISQMEEYLTISVADDGVGIEPELHEQIFERFYEKSITTHSNLKGTGIGLAISKQMIELHRGKIFVEKDTQRVTFQQGATFVVQIPRGKAHFGEEAMVQDLPDREQIQQYRPLPTPGKQQAAYLSTEQKKKDKDLPLLLLVEDHPDLRAYIRQIFTPKYRVVTAENGVEGWDKVKKYLPQLIISDVMMPQMDGITFCGKLKADFEVSHIPIILLTARANALAKIEGLKMGADDYVTKPFDPQELMLRAHNIIQARREIKEKFVRVMSFDPKEIAVTSADETFLENALRLAEENISNPEFNVTRFAADLAVSRPLLFTKLKALTGQTPNNFMKTIRLKRAAQLLRSQKLNVSEVAYQTGFKDLKYFRKCFKDQFNTRPSEFGKTSDN